MREDSIRPDRLKAAQQEAIDWDIAWLLARRPQWVETDCPSCAGAGHSLEFEKAGFAYRRCRDCGTLFTSPRPTDSTLSEFYAVSHNYDFFCAHIFPATEETRLENIFRPRAAMVQQLCSEHGIRRGRLLEIGAGFGTFVRAARELDFLDSITVVQTGPLAEQCRLRGADAVITGLMDDLKGQGQFDVVACFEVIEHAADPAAFLGHVRARLRPGGLLVLSCPNVQGFDILELGPLSDSVDHEHLNYFHPGSLRGLLERVGLRYVSHSTPGKLDAELVQKKWTARPELARDPFLSHVLLEGAEDVRAAFQRFLSENGLSSHLVIAAKRPEEDA